MRRNCFHQLKGLNNIPRFVPQDQFDTLMHAFIISRIDFCNSIYCTTCQGRTRINEPDTQKFNFKRPRVLTVDSRSLKHALPSVWNSLPQELRNIQRLSSCKSSLNLFYFESLIQKSVCELFLGRCLVRCHDQVLVNFFQFFVFQYIFHLLSTALFYQPI